MSAANTALSLGNDPQTKKPSEVIKKDYDEREFVQIVQVNVMKLVEFINHFDHSMRYKLASLNEKLRRLEDSILYFESVGSQVEIDLEPGT